ncbi:unnamed protein product [Prorocentrum cordatum]|uniref:Uncharacterized protein n=1 Tax=Prorocentrum cordatum TaxID=2364126 RepID=A0ABN9UJZ0_9DINO|nr:unnamed protein product [Polarella glacialis]
MHFTNEARFRLRVVPMGWSWAVYFAQSAMKNLLVTSVDASLHGFGVTARQFESTSVGKVPFSFFARGSDHDFLETGAQTEFPEVPERFAKDSPWCVIAARRSSAMEFRTLRASDASRLRSRSPTACRGSGRLRAAARLDTTQLPTTSVATPARVSARLAAAPTASPPVAHRHLGPGPAGSAAARPARRVGNARRQQVRRGMRQSPSTLIGSAGRAATRLAGLGFRASALGAASVTTATQDKYLTHLEMLLRWLVLRRAPTLDKDEWDVLLTSYIEHLYDSGATENAGGTTLAAVRWAEPAIPRPLRRGLPLASAALAGWRRAEPGRARPPMPRELAIAIALDLCDCGLPSLGFFVMLVFETCMRPSEALALQRFQLVPLAGDGMPGTKGRWAVLIRALELGRPGKTDDFDGSVSLDLPRHQLLVPGLEEIFSRRGERDPVFLFDYVTLLRCDARIGHCKVFLDIFAGTGPVGRFLRERGHGVIFFEKKLGPIRRTQVSATVMGWLRAGRVRGFWVAAPCVTTTRARQNGAAGMPPPLRSNEHLRGLLGLGERLK